ncbi:MAG: hypothetical protein ABI175_10105 [Polyangiales bacterium]
MSPAPSHEAEVFEDIDREIGAIETVQANKVIELARRLLPGLTAEDIRNPHDFPDLDDPDWQYEDGVLAGIQSVRIALRAMKYRRND